MWVGMLSSPSMTLKRQVQQPKLTRGVGKCVLFCQSTRGIRLSKTHQTTNSLIARPLSKKYYLGNELLLFCAKEFHFFTSFEEKYVGWENNE